MQSSTDVYITVGLDKKGNVVEVRVKGEPIKPKETSQGLLRQGASAPGCEEVVKRLVHELLVCRKKGDKPRTGTGTGYGAGSGTGSEPGPVPGSDPCCYRDPATGRLWCWC